MLLIIIFPQIFAITLACKADKMFENWPNYCCQLELRDTYYYLSEDYVFAGSSRGQNFTYVVENDTITVKSELYTNYPMNPADNCKQVNYYRKYKYLANPNKCVLKWYTLRYEGERFPFATGQSFENGRYYAPSIGNYYFASFKHDKDYIPGHKLDATTRACSLSSPDRAEKHEDNGAGHRILTIDCLKSLTTMTDTSLANISIPDELPPSTKNVIHFHRKFNNNSPLNQKQKVGFSVERTNKVQVSLSELYASTRCDEKSDTFSTTFSASLSFGFGIFGLSFSTNIGTSITNTMSTRTSVCTQQSMNRTTTNIEEEIKRYTFNDEITIPPNSMTSINAYSTPIQGVVDYNVTYNVKPRVGNKTKISNIVTEGFKFFKLADYVENNGEDVIVKFPGTVSIDSGYEVTVDVKSVPLNGSLNEGSNSLASYTLIPDEK